MQKRRLGQTDIEVSVLGLGTVKFGRNEGVKYPQHFTLPRDDEIKNLLSASLEVGINLLDTAPAYGSSEARLGKLLKTNRSKWVICTKVGERFEKGRSEFDFTEAGMIKSVEESLKKLQTDYLDILLIHSSGDDIKIIEEDRVFDTLMKLKALGKIRAYGFSSKTIVGGLRALSVGDVVMVTHNLASQAEQEVIDEARRTQKGIFIKKAFNSGHLDAKTSLQFALQTQGVTSVIIGTINPLHLKENAQVALAIES
ncbi:MAG: aldo/keto reductase [Gammaproteobacteria bacterium]|nr:aldo/keto reductase [Gammaproteobacteria bacterium]